MLRAVFLDFDGLILDTEQPDFDSWVEVYASFGHDLPLERWISGIGTRGGFDPYVHLEGLLGRALDYDAIRAVRRPRNEAMIAALPLLDGVEALLDEARALGLKTAVVSSSDASWVQPHLDGRGLASRFDVVICAASGLSAKPDPALYLAALAHFGVAADEAVAFEDSPHGIAAAKAAGLRCIAVPNAITRTLDLSVADRIVASLTDISLRDMG